MRLVAVVHLRLNISALSQFRRDVLHRYPCWAGVVDVLNLVVFVVLK